MNEPPTSDEAATDEQDVVRTMSTWPHNQQRYCPKCDGYQTQYATTWHCHRCGYHSNRNLSPKDQETANQFAYELMKPEDEKGLAP